MSRHGSGGQVVKPPASRVRAGACERHRCGDAPTLDVGYKPIPLAERGGNAASVHVVQVLVLLAVEDVVVDDLEASEARARRGPPMNARSLQRIRGVGADVDELPALGLLALRAVGLP